MTEQQQAAMAAAEKALEGQIDPQWPDLTVYEQAERLIACRDALALLRDAGDGWEPVELSEVIRSPRPGDCVVGPASKTDPDRRIKMECIAIKMDKSGVTHTSVKIGIQSNFNVAGTSDLNSVAHWQRLASTPGTELIHAADRMPLTLPPQTGGK